MSAATPNSHHSQLERAGIFAPHHGLQYRKAEGDKVWEVSNGQVDTHTGYHSLPAAPKPLGAARKRGQTQRQFYKNLAEGRFTTTKCKDCGKLLYPPVAICSECLSENLVWVGIPKVGEVYAFTEILAGAPLQFQDKVPFVVAIVRFGNYPENGIQLSGTVFDASYDEMEVGA